MKKKKKYRGKVEIIDPKDESVNHEYYREMDPVERIHLGQELRYHYMKVTNETPQRIKRVLEVVKHKKSMTTY